MPAVIPLVTTGISAGVGLWQQRKAGQQLKEQQAQGQALTGEALNQGRTLFNRGMPALGQATSYYGTLLNGSRSAMTQAVSPEIGAIGDVYRGAERNLERSGIRGAQRDVAKAEMARERAGRTASLIGGVRPMAADRLSQIGQFMTGQGTSAVSGAGGLAANFAGVNQQARQYHDQQSAALWANIGKLMTGSYGAWRDWRNTRTQGGMLPNGTPNL